MSLDVALIMPGSINPQGSGIFIRQDGRTIEITRAEWDEKFPGMEPISIWPTTNSYVFEANITHNLAKMAENAGIYKYLWRPDEIKIDYAEQLISPLTIGLTLLESNPSYFRKFDPPNGWGTYDTLVSFVEEYLGACKRYPQAKISVSR